MARFPRLKKDVVVLMAGKKVPPIHPGEVLNKEFLMPLGLTQYRLAKNISVPPRRVNEIVLGRRGITADTALRLARYFGTTDRFWLNLQARYDLEIERDRLGGRLDQEVTIHTFRTFKSYAAGDRGSRSVRGVVGPDDPR